MWWWSEGGGGWDKSAAFNRRNLRYYTGTTAGDVQTHWALLFLNCCSIFSKKERMNLMGHPFFYKILAQSFGDHCWRGLHLFDSRNHSLDAHPICKETPWGTFGQDLDGYWFTIDILCKAIINTLHLSKCHKIAKFSKVLLGYAKKCNIIVTAKHCKFFLFTCQGLHRPKTSDDRCGTRL